MLLCLFLELVQEADVGVIPNFYDPHSAGSALCSGCDMMIMLSPMPACFLLGSHESASPGVMSVIMMTGLSFLR